MRNVHFWRLCRLDEYQHYMLKFDITTLMCSPFDLWLWWLVVLVQLLSCLSQFGLVYNSINRLSTAGRGPFKLWAHGACVGDAPLFSYRPHSSEQRLAMLALGIWIALFGRPSFQSAFRHSL